MERVQSKKLKAGLATTRGPSAAQIKEALRTHPVIKPSADMGDANVPLPRERPAPKARQFVLDGYGEPEKNFGFDLSGGMLLDQLVVSYRQKGDHVTGSRLYYIGAVLLCVVTISPVMVVVSFNHIAQGEQHRNY